MNRGRKLKISEKIREDERCMMWDGWCMMSEVWRKTSELSSATISSKFQVCHFVDFRLRPVELNLLVIRSRPLRRSGSKFLDEPSDKVDDQVLRTIALTSILPLSSFDNLRINPSSLIVVLTFLYHHEWGLLSWLCSIRGAVALSCVPHVELRSFSSYWPCRACSRSG